ncbi:MAG: hypothetical protein AB1742_06880 [bacterium]
MLRVLWGAIALSIVHALMPDHWLPLAMIARTERWNRAETTLITAAVALPHVLSTVAVGTAVGLAGYTLSATHEAAMRTAAPLALVVVGAAYVYLDFAKKGHVRRDAPGRAGAGTKIAVAASLAAALFFSPCIPVGAYFFVAGRKGAAGIATVSAVYTVVTVAGMVALVNLALRGAKKVEWEFLERRERLVTGLVLIVIGVFVYFVEI